MKKRIIILLSLLIVFLTSSVWYLTDYYHAEESVKKFLESSDIVQVTKIKEGYFFDGPGEESAIIFYPGAKVEETSYAPILFKLAEEGVDSFLLSMPFHIAFFGENKADSIMEQYEYKDYYLMGHSLRWSSCVKFCF